MKEDYIKIPVQMLNFREAALEHLGIPVKLYFFLHKDLKHHLVEAAHGNLGVFNSISYDAPKGYIKYYHDEDDICKKIKATKLAKKMYPNPFKEEDGWLYIVRDGLMLR